MTDRGSVQDARDFTQLTEVAGTALSPEGADMIYTRYRYAAELGTGKRVLEIAAGSGLGLGLLCKTASHVVAGDIDLELLRRGRAQYGGRARLLCLDATRLPFAEASFDVVLFFEALYYVPDPASAFDEVARVVAPGGTVVFVNANPDRRDFIASPRSVTYHSATDFRRELEARGFDVTVEAAFPFGREGRLAPLTSVVRRMLSPLGLVPKTLKGRAMLKRLIYGPGIALPAELTDGFGSCAERIPIVDPGAVTGFKVLYVSGRRRFAHPGG